MPDYGEFDGSFIDMEKDELDPTKQKRKQEQEEEQDMFEIGAYDTEEGGEDE